MESNVGLSRAIISRRGRLQGRKKRSNEAPAPPLHGSGRGIQHRLGQRHYPWEGETPVKENGASKPPQLEAAMESNAGLSRAIISWRGREWRNRISAWVSAPPLALVTTISWTWSIGTAILWLEPIPSKSPSLLIPPRFYQEEKGGEGGENQSPFHLEGTTRAGSRRKETEEERRTSEWPSSLSPFRSAYGIFSKNDLTWPEIPHLEPPRVSKPIWSLAFSIQTPRRTKQGVA